MPEEEIEKPENEEKAPDEPIPERRARRYFKRRHVGLSAGAIAILIVLLGLLLVVVYRYGVYDNYIKDQFVAKMADIGMVFDAEVFRVTVNPLELELKNAAFKDRISGENLFTVREAHLHTRGVPYSG